MTWITGHSNSGAKWHGFDGYGKGQYFIDPMKLQFVTEGIDVENGGYEKFGIPGNISQTTCVKTASFRKNAT